MSFDRLKFLRRASLLLILPFHSGCAESPWFLPHGCSGADLALSVTLDGESIFEARGPACDEYEHNIDGRWDKEKLSFEFEPGRAITWTGYREHPFDSPSDEPLRVDLWLAGAAIDEDIWLIGVSVQGEYAIYLNTMHIADLNGARTSCIAEDFCVSTSSER